MGGNEPSISKKERSSALQLSMQYTGKLKLLVKQAKDLEKKDVLQKADPYVIINYGSQTSKSKKVKNTLTPVWNHEVIFDLITTGPKEIEIKLMDWERFGKDEPMGKVLLPVDLAVSRSYQDSFWLDLDDCKSGQILVSTQFSGLEESVIQSHITKESHIKSIPFTAEENESKDSKEYVTMKHEESEDKKENCDTEVKEIIEEFLNEGTSDLEITENTALKSN